MNANEALGRELKAQSIARKIWAHMPRELRSHPDLAAVFAKATPEERRGWADVAEVKKAPSDLTWARVCEILQDRVHEERHWLSLDERSA